MFYGEEESDFQSLPPEMIVEVLSHVDIEGKQSGRLVCRRWRWILDHPDAGLVCFKETYGDMTEDSIQCLLKSQLYIDHLVLNDVKMTWPAMTFTRNKFPPIRQLTLESGNSSQTLMTILQYGCAQTESLTLDQYCFSHVRLDLLSCVLSGMRWNHLTELSLYVIANSDTFQNYDGVEFSSVNSRKKSQKNNVEGIELIFKKARIPNLRVLALDLRSVGETELPTGLQKLMSTVAIFLEHHSRTLKELRLSIYLLFVDANHQEILIFPRLPAPLFSAEQQESVAQDLNLECLDITTTYVDALVHLVPPCVWESDNLTKFKWLPKWDDLNPISSTPPITPTPIRSLIQRNCNTLTNVTTTFILGHIVSDPFQILWLESCPHLRELTITNCDKFFDDKVKLPTVRKLGINLIWGFDSVENMSTWISRTFQNLDAVQFSFCFTAVVQNLQFHWIRNMLLLPRLGQIRFEFTHYWYEDNEESHDDMTELNLIRQYCSDEPRLTFSGERQRERADYTLRTGSCLIKILPTQNYN